eukprot:768795-Hanusia_phi.AAC.11
MLRMPCECLDITRKPTEEQLAEHPHGAQAVLDLRKHFTCTGEKEATKGRYKMNKRAKDETTECQRSQGDKRQKLRSKWQRDSTL